MRDKREIVFWSSVIFLAQILLMLAQMTQYGGEDLYQPLKFLYGDGYGRAKLHNVEQYMWLLELSLYCIVTVRKIVQYKEEDSYMMIVRYPDFRSYYRAAYGTFVKYTVLYQIFLFLGTLAGTGVVRLGHSVRGVCWQPFLLSQGCMFLGNLCFGIIMFYLILHFNAVKLAVVLYPGLPVIAIVLRERIPEAVSNWTPGSWLMAARSSRMVSGGFPVGIVFLIEIIIFTAVSILSVEKRLCVPVS